MRTRRFASDNMYKPIVMKFYLCIRSAGILLAITVMAIAGGNTGVATLPNPVQGVPGHDDPDRPPVIEVSGNNGEAIRSTDGGSTWTRIVGAEETRRQSRLARSASLTGLPDIIHISSLNSLGSFVVIRFELHVPSEIGLCMCSVSGVMLYSSNEGSRQPGTHSIVIDVSRFPRGLYCCLITCNGLPAAVEKLSLN